MVVRKDTDIKRKALGKAGEEMAARLLESRGYTVLERNWRASHKEIDLICRDGVDLRFVEVKTRQEPMEGEPWEAVNPKKQRNIASAAGAYLASEQCRALPGGVNESHFDVITIVWDEQGENCRTEYIPDAYILIYV